MHRLTPLIAVVAALITAAPATADPVVVGGTRAAPGEFPWMVRLSMSCGGSLIGRDVVLTAGHCVGRTGPTTGITAIIGTVDLAAADAVTMRSAHVLRAPGYVNYDRGDDWALIRLAEPVEAPALPVVATPEHNSGMFTVMGWGADREGGGQQRWLMKAQVPFVDDATCGASYRDSGVSFLDEAMICAGLFGVGGVDTCQGDSGGPMVTQLPDGRYLQVGIVSWGHGCAQPQYPGVYTELSAYADQITAALAELPPAADPEQPEEEPDEPPRHEPGPTPDPSSGERDTADSEDGKFTQP